MNKPRISGATLPYAKLQGLLWANVAAISGYLNPYLKDRGLTVSQIGILIAISAIGGAMMQPLTGRLADRRGKPTLKQLMLAILGIFAIFAAATAILHTAGGMALAVVYCLALLTWQLLVPLVNAAGLTDGPEENQPNYPVSRGIGSLTYAAVFFAMGQLIVGRFWLIPAVMLALMALMVAAVLRCPMPDQRERPAGVQGGGGLFLLRYPRYCMMLLGSIVVLIGHGVINHFAIQIVNSHGGAEPQMGGAMALACLMELPVMFGFGFLRKRFTALQMLCVSAVFFTLKCVVTWVTTTMTGFYLAQLFQMPAFALYAVSSVLFVSQEMEPDDAVKGQTWLSLGQSAATILASFFGGQLVERQGVDALMRYAVITSAVGAMVMLLAEFVPRRRKSRMP